MNCRFAFEGLDLFDSLERKLSMSCLWGYTTTTVVPVSDGHVPPPGPEPDPGPLPTDNPPIVLPPFPPSGPVGPG